jgi:hypothetical protein
MQPSLAEMAVFGRNQLRESFCKVYNAPAFRLLSIILAGDAG